MSAIQKSFSVRSRNLSFVMPGVLLSLATAAGARAAVSYTVLDLGTLGGTTSKLDGFGTINASGQVAGYSWASGGTIGHAVRTTANAKMLASSDLGLFGGATSFAYGLNASGQAVGAFTVSGAGTHAFRSGATGAGGTDLGTLNTSGAKVTTTYAYGINATGQTVGYSALGDGTAHAYRTAANGLITAASDLGTLGGTNSYAYAINTSGQVVGDSLTVDNLRRAFRTTATGIIDATTSNLGTLGGDSYARGINDTGQVVGTSTTAGGLSHAFRTTANGSITLASDLGTLGGTSSNAVAINSTGQTVGDSATANNAATHAFFVDTTGVMIDLNTLIPSNSGWTLQYATGINDSGQISGYGLVGGATHAFELTIAPEPIALGVIGIATIVAISRRRAL